MARLVRAEAARGRGARPRPVRRGDARAAPRRTRIICNGAGNFSGWWHRYWRYGRMPTQLAPTSGTMGYGLPAAVAARYPLQRPAGRLRCRRRRFPDERSGAGDRRAIWRRLARHRRRQRRLRHHPHAPGARISRSACRRTELRNPDFAALARAFGGWAETVEKTEDFAPALDRGARRKGIRLIHCKTDVEQITNATTHRENPRESESLELRSPGAVRIRQSFTSTEIPNVTLRSAVLLRLIQRLARSSADPFDHSRRARPAKLPGNLCRRCVIASSADAAIGTRS